MKTVTFLNCHVCKMYAVHHFKKARACVMSLVMNSYCCPGMLPKFVYVFFASKLKNIELEDILKRSLVRWDRASVVIIL